MNIAFLQQDAAKHATDKAKEERYNQWLKFLSKDIYLEQAVKVVGDIRLQQSLAKGKEKKEKPVKAF